jgi:hypothetical protein
VGKGEEGLGMGQAREGEAWRVGKGEEGGKKSLEGSQLTIASCIPQGPLCCTAR